MTHLTLDELVAMTSSAGAYVDMLQAYALESRAVRHPLLADVADGNFFDLQTAIRRFLGQYYFYSRRFTQALGATLAALDIPDHRAMLVGNMAEESGFIDPEHERTLLEHGIDPEWVKFAHPLLF